ncbi:GDP-mannose 4,6-dehydratase [Thalassobaculum sp. OXR-137]|uniref:GDP-mannose 4,6-dehydratase n=1 Tax=Thalassobaculum sp. OXR-137 TaxID=3100173 RepID=UPI002AC93B08|nr:GDP-mannose 4,6-dehydratase [Thalassobaculum sp. OXR-137]WPZ36188.1 GDP-mannose 4,6-dehydratase [Thalassobaculum sp. OXR-137]
MAKTVLIVGAAGQDGTLLSRRHRRQGDRVIGLSRNGVSDGTVVQHAPLDLCDPLAVPDLIDRYRPQTIYYLAAYHHSSEDRPNGEQAADLRELFKRSVDTNLLGWLNWLAAADSARSRPRLFYASSSLVFGHPSVPVADENAPLDPKNPYGITKVSAMQAADFYRENRDLHVSTGILFNHESIRRSTSFVTRKITQAAARAALGDSSPLALRNPWATVDWTAAEDAVSAMSLICDQEDPGTYVIGTGITRSVMDFTEEAFGALGLPAPRIEYPEDAIPKKGIAARPEKLMRIGWQTEYPWPKWIHRMAKTDYRLARCRSGS